MIYVDDLLVISENAQELLTKIDLFFLLQADSIQKPKTYLGAEITQVTLPNDVHA